MPPCKATGNNGKSIWIDPEVVAFLDGLIDKKTTHQSGNGWKPTVWPEIVSLVQAANPTADPKKDQVKSSEKPGPVPFRQEVGWDDEENDATATAEFIETFIKANGPKYTKCFKKPCPFYTKLNEIFDGLVNKATGEHVVHLSGDKRKLGKKSNALKKAPAPATAETSVAALGDSSEKENNVVEVDKGQGGSKGKGRAVFDDELSMSPREKVTRKRERAISDDDNTPQGQLHKHKNPIQVLAAWRIAMPKPAHSSQKSVKTLSAAMGTPIITSEDLSYIDKVINILKDKSLLPPNPKGQLFRIVCQKQSGDPGLICYLIVKEDYMHCKILSSLLLPTGLGQEVVLIDPRMHSKKVVQGTGHIDHQSLLLVAYLRGDGQYLEMTLWDAKNVLNDVAELSVLQIE
ncbi:hypothetical protein B0H14DRAFT_3514846 [Mycena olivaceomarginata]|nr:hypothetical protein B0H14DRAFT_3514846 [Mycena olivaceomarginata]